MKPINGVTATLAANVRRYRLRSGKSQTWLAKEIGMSRTNLVNIEAGRTATSIEGLVALADALECHPGELLVEPERCPTCGQMLAQDLPEIEA